MIVQEPSLVARPEMHVYATPGDITFSAEKRGQEAAFVIALANGFLLLRERSLGPKRISVLR